MEFFSYEFQHFIGQVFLIVAIPVLTVMAWNLWLTYIQTVYLQSIDWVILEIRPPKEVFKSPEAMELVLNTLHGGGFGNWYEQYWKGEMAQYYSLEIVSIEGKIHFFVRFAKKFKKAFEAQIYAQYPQAEVVEVTDYTKRVPDYKKGGPINLFAYDVGLKKDKGDPYPIKTYVDYGLDRSIGSLDEEQRIDPITPMLEIMGSIGAGEQIWVQINIRQDTKRFSITKDGVVVPKKSWKDKGRELIKEFIEKNTKDGRRLTRGEQAVVEALERHMNKLGFDAGIRVLYVAEKEKFSGNTITAFTTMFRQFATEDMNSLALKNLTKVDYPWTDLFGTKLYKQKKGFLDAYKARAFFYGGFDIGNISKWFTSPSKSGATPFLLSTEELATIFHLPGRVAETPSFTRIEAKKAEPPANLPF